MKSWVAVAACGAIFTAPAFAQVDKNPGHLKMALVAMKSQVSDSPDAAANKKNIQMNLDRHLYFIDKAVAEGAEFVGFPELSVNGYHFSKDMTWLSLTGPEVQALAKKAAEKKVYVAAGIAEADAAGKKWNTHFVIGPDGKVAGWHHKIWLTSEKGFTEVGTHHNVFPVKGLMMGISTCADNTDFGNPKALAEAGAQIIYGPHANTTGSTLAGWYKFRARWGGPCDGTMAKGKTSNEGPEAEMPAGGWMAKLKLYAALHNHAGLYNPEFNPPVAADTNNRFASGAWFIGPDGATLAQMPTSAKKEDSKEFLLICNIPIPKK
jgi:predicted amidohydrolase